jgi:hypothetical protein
LRRAVEEDGGTASRRGFRDGHANAGALLNLFDKHGGGGAFGERAIS